MRKSKREIETDLDDMEPEPAADIAVFWKAELTDTEYHGPIPEVFQPDEEEQEGN